MPGPTPAPMPPTTPSPLPSPAAPAGHAIALLAPLTGPNAALGPALVNAAQLALVPEGSPALDVRDTGGTPDGAAAAASAALAAGAGLIIGPLTAAETAAVVPLARSADVAVLAFTNDPMQAQPGVWPLASPRCSRCAGWSALPSRRTRGASPPPCPIPPSVSRWPRR